MGWLRHNPRRRFASTMGHPGLWWSVGEAGVVVEIRRAADCGRPLCHGEPHGRLVFEDYVKVAQSLPNFTYDHSAGGDGLGAGLFAVLSAENSGHSAVRLQDGNRRRRILAGICTRGKEAASFTEDSNHGMKLCAQDGWVPGHSLGSVLVE